MLHYWLGGGRKICRNQKYYIKNFLEVGVQVVSFREAINNSLHLKIISFLDVLFFYYLASV